MFRQTLKWCALVVAAMTLTGCGDKPKIPENTLAAVYVDLDNLIDNGIEVAKMAIDEMPDDKAEEAQKGLDEAVKTYKKQFKQCKFQWAVFTAGVTDGNISRPELAFVIRCDYDKEAEDGSTFRKLFEENLMHNISWGETEFVEGKYVITANTSDVMDKMIALYRDGKGETSDAFDDLADLDGDTVARAQIAGLKTWVDVFDGEEEIKRIGKDCDDEDLIDDLMDGGPIMLDFKLSEDVFGTELAVDAGSKDLAKALEGVGNILKFSSRVGVDLGCTTVARTLVEPIRRSRMAAGRELEDGAAALGKMMEDEGVRELVKQVREASSCERSGAKVRFKCEYDTEDFLEQLIPIACKAMRGGIFAD